MGLLTLPLRGLWAVFEELVEHAERSYYDESAIRGELARLYRAADAGELEREDFARLEEQLALRLLSAQERRSGGAGSR